MSERNEVFKMLYETEQSSFQEMTGKVGWTYKDLPKMTREFFDQFIEAVGGEENIHFITYATYPPFYSPKSNNPTELVRGQVMISPNGIESLRTYSRAN